MTVDFPYCFEGMGWFTIKGSCKAINDGYCTEVTFKIVDDEDTIVKIDLDKDTFEDIMETVEEALVNEYYNQDVYMQMH